MVLFDDGEDLQVIEVPLISSSKFEEFVEFKVVLIEPQGKCSLGNNQKENIEKRNYFVKNAKLFGEIFVDNFLSSTLMSPKSTENLKLFFEICLQCYVRLLPPEAKFAFSEKYLTYRLSEKMAIIPVERRFTSGISTLKWHTRWSKDEKGADDGDGDETGDEAKNWASGFIVFKVGCFQTFLQNFRVSKNAFGPEILQNIF